MITVPPRVKSSQPDLGVPTLRLPKRAAVGSSLADVVDSTNYFGEDFQSVYPVFEAVRKEIFAGRLPASTSVGVANLLEPRFHVEVKLVAVCSSE
jgi:enamine deaminase RidA (YjgF/YER057c/UK114 family)